MAKFPISPEKKQSFLKFPILIFTPCRRNTVIARPPSSRPPSRRPAARWLETAEDGGISMGDFSDDGRRYPLVYIPWWKKHIIPSGKRDHKTMERSTMLCSWVNQLFLSPCSMSQTVNVCQRVGRKYIGDDINLYKSGYFMGYFAAYYWDMDDIS